VSDNSKAKTIKLKPEMRVIVRSHLIDNDSLSFSRFYDGSFVEGSSDAIKIKLTNYSESKKDVKGIINQTTIPGKSFFMIGSMDTGMVSIPLNEIQYINYRHKKSDKMAEFIEGPVYISLIAILLAPIISYDFKNGGINAERYKYWGTGSVVALSTSFCIEFAVNSHHEYQFKKDWPWKKKKIWSFKKES